MDGSFDIRVDSARHLVTMRLTGFFTPETFDRFKAERAVAFTALRCGPNQHLSLTDVREVQIQSQDIVSAFGQVLADPAYRSKRLAFVTPTSLARMQLHRVISQRADGSTRCFTDPVAAEHWVLTGTDS